jgi:hypothetical protein
MGINMSKVCIKCKQTKSTTEFSNDKQKKDGLSPYCKPCISLRDKNWSKNNRDKVNKCISNWVSNNKEKHSEYQKQYQIDNRDRINEIASKSQKKRRQDNKVKLHQAIRSRINERLKQIGTNKSKATLTIVGLENWDKLREHIEKQFIEGMNWDNYGNTPNSWSIDHITPISSAQTEEEIYKLNHYTNLQPMWHIDNIKKSNKIF